MKEVEFINSRVEEPRSQRSTDDYPARTDGASEPTDASSTLAADERDAVLKVLRDFTDTLTIYRFTLDNRVRGGTHFREDFDEDEMTIQMREDSVYVSSLLEVLTRDVANDGRYDALIREIRDKRKRQDDEEAVVRDYEEARDRVAQLRKLVDEETRTNARDREELRAQLVRSQMEKERLELKVGIESRYVRATVRARREGRSLRCGVAVKSLEDSLGNLSSVESNENRVASEIEAFLEQNVTANEEATSHWLKRHETEMQMYRKENGRLSDEIENRRRALEKLQLQYRERQEFIERYVEERDAATERKKREEHRERCSIRIQSWWRGVMVRRKLGPYRPDEKKKKRPVKSKK